MFFNYCTEVHSGSRGWRWWYWVQGGAENHMEVPQGNWGDVKVQGGAGNHMKVPQGNQGNVQVQRGRENCMQLLERDTDVRHKPRLPMYWSTDSILATPIFNQVRRRDRFLFLFRFFHFADNTKYNPADPDGDKLYKIRELINKIKDRCGKVYSPEKSFSMDESLVLFKGRLSFKQYIRSKRARFGIKLYQLCTFNGILLDFMVYHGNLEPGLISLKNCPLITERIPATVMQKYLNKGHHLFIDNYYTSLSLAEYLMQNRTYVTGTIKEHRKHFPVEMKALSLEKRWCSILPTWRYGSGKV